MTNTKKSSRRTL